MSMLRGPHDRHRDLPTRWIASLTPDDRNQDRHLMRSVTSIAKPSAAAPGQPRSISANRHRSTQSRPPKGRDRLKTMTLNAAEFIRRFLMHVLPTGFHRIRHYALFASPARTRNIDRARQLLAMPVASPEPSGVEADNSAESPAAAHRCPCCGGRMIVIETFEGVRPARSPSPSRIRIDTS
jgi:Putative transposase